MNGIRPEFAVVGAVIDGRCCLWASNRLSQAELESVYENENYTWGGAYSYRLPVARRHEIHVTAHDLVHVQADTWAEAWQLLFDAWTPDSTPAARTIRGASADLLEVDCAIPHRPKELE